MEKEEYVLEEQDSKELKNEEGKGNLKDGKNNPKIQNGNGDDPEEGKKVKEKEEKKINLGYIFAPIAGVIVITIGTIIFCKKKNKKIEDNSKIKKEPIQNRDIINRIVIYNNIPISETRRISSENNLQSENLGEDNDTNNGNNILKINKEDNKTMDKKIISFN